MQRDWETALLLGERNLSYLYSRALSVVVSGRCCVNALAEQTVLAECLHPSMSPCTGFRCGCRLADKGHAAVPEVCGTWHGGLRAPRVPTVLRAVHVAHGWRELTNSGAFKLGYWELAWD